MCELSAFGMIGDRMWVNSEIIVDFVKFIGQR